MPIVSESTPELRAEARRQVANARQKAYEYIGYLGYADDETVARRCFEFGGKASQYGHIIRSFSEDV